MLKRLLKTLLKLFVKEKTIPRNNRPQHRSGNGPWMYSDTGKHVNPKKKQLTLRLTLDRVWYTKSCTIGKLSIDGVFECYILEDYDRLSKGRRKKHGETAIPKGRYEIRITYSRRFKRRLPLLTNVPGFTGIRIHAGNTAQDTRGCLLPGTYTGENFVGQSKLAFNALFKKLERAEQENKRITIKVA